MASLVGLGAVDRGQEGRLLEKMAVRIDYKRW